MKYSLAIILLGLAAAVTALVKPSNPDSFKPLQTAAEETRLEREYVEQLLTQR
jgi:hypothetical protein